MSNELQILNQNSIVTAFATKGGINELFERVAQEVRKEVPDVTTQKGRDAIGSLAAKVSKSKKIIEEAGKALVAEQKAQIKLIDDDRIAVVKMFDTLRDEVLAPRDAWKKAEDDRVSDLQKRVDEISLPCEFESSHFIKSNIEYIKSIEIDDSFMEFKDKAKLAKFEKLESLGALLIQAEKQEAEQAELEKQRIAEQERLQREHEERIAQQAAEQARIDAEQKAKAEIEKAEREKKEAIEREAKLKLEAEQAILREKQMKESAERAAKQAEIDKQKAIEAERLRIEQQQKAEAEHQSKLEEQRKANIEHMRQINNDVLSSLVKIGISEDQAKAIITMIAKNEVPHVSIKY
jgi:colicin import membrane protein